MGHVMIKKFRDNIMTYFDEVAASKNPLLITRSGAESMIMLTESEYRSILETLHLLSTPANANRLRESIKELNDGNLIEVDPTI